MNISRLQSIAPSGIALVVLLLAGDAIGRMAGWW